MTVGGTAEMIWGIRERGGAEMLSRFAVLVGIGKGLLVKDIVWLYFVSCLFLRGGRKESYRACLREDQFTEFRWLASPSGAASAVTERQR